MQAALSATPDAVWVCAALNDRERTLARQAPRRPAVASCRAGRRRAARATSTCACCRSTRRPSATPTTASPTRRCGSCCTCCYDLPTQPVFDAAWRRQWAAYVRYNQAFADAHRRRGGADGATVMVQDYHLFLAAADAARRCVRTCGSATSPTRRGCRPDYFTMLPDDVGYAIVDGMLGADVIGFHTAAVGRPVRATTAEAVCRREARTACRCSRSAPTPDELRKLAQPARRRQRAAGARATSVGDRLVIGRVDRTELSKNVYRGLLAYRELLRTPPRVARPGRARGVQQPLARGPARLPRVHRVASSGWPPRSTTSSAPTTGRRWCSRSHDDYPAALAALRRSDVVFVELGARRHEPGRPRGPGAVRARPGGRASRARPARPRCSATTRSSSTRSTSRRRAEALHAALSHRPARSGRARAERMRAAAVRLPPAEWFQAQLDALPLSRSSERRQQARPRRRGSATLSVGGVGRARRPRVERTATPEGGAALRSRSCRDVRRRRGGRRGRRRGTAPPARSPASRSQGAGLVVARQAQLEDVRGRGAPRGRARRPARRPARAAARARRPDRRPAGRARPATAACPRSTPPGRRRCGEHGRQPVAAAARSVAAVSGGLERAVVPGLDAVHARRPRPGHLGAARRGARTVSASRPVITATWAPRRPARPARRPRPSTGRDCSGSGTSGASVPSKSSGDQGVGHDGRAAPSTISVGASHCGCAHTSPHPARCRGSPAGSADHSHGESRDTPCRTAPSVVGWAV